MPRVKVPQPVSIFYSPSGWSAEFSLAQVSDEVWTFNVYLRSSRYTLLKNHAAQHAVMMGEMELYLSEHAVRDETWGWIAKTKTMRSCSICEGNNEVEKDVLGRYLCLDCINRRGETDKREEEFEEDE